MGRLFVVLTVLFLSVAAGTGTVTAGERSGDEVKAEVRKQFEEILELWRDGNYTDLYRRTTGGRDSLEKFAGRLAEAPKKPACCWEKLQNPEIALAGDSAATLFGKVGLEGVGNTTFQTRSFNLTRSGNIWRVSRSDILSLAGPARKKRAVKTSETGH